MSVWLGKGEPANAQKIELVPGTTCWIKGLSGDVLRNGTCATLVEWVEPRGRWKVQTHTLLKDKFEFIGVKPVNLQAIKEPENCAICLDPIVLDHQQTICGHSFHSTCLRTSTESWRQAESDETRRLKCPLCNAWIGLKTDLGIIHKDGLDIVHGGLGYVYQQVAAKFKLDDSVEAEIEVVSAWHENLIRIVPSWLHELNVVKGRHTANPSRETGKALDVVLKGIFVNTFDPHDKQGWRETREPVRLAYYFSTTNWILCLLGVFSPDLQVIGPEDPVS